MPSPSPIHFCLQKNTRDNTEKQKHNQYLIIHFVYLAASSPFALYYNLDSSLLFSAPPHPFSCLQVATWCVCPVKLLLQQFCLLWLVAIIDDWTLPLRNDWHWIFWQQLANVIFSTPTLPSSLLYSCWLIFSVLFSFVCPFLNPCQVTCSFDFFQIGSRRQHVRFIGLHAQVGEIKK